MNFFWVNIGLSFKEVINGQFLWAPIHSQKQDENGNIRTTRFSHWDNVALVRKGDIIFCNHDRMIEFVAVAKEDAYQAPQPETRVFNGWDAQGYKVEVALFPLAPPLSIEGYISESFTRRYNERATPRVVNRNGNIFQGYMAAISLEAGIDLLRLTGDQEELIIMGSEMLATPPEPRKKITAATTRQALREARIGQGSFRKALIDLWRQCPVSEVTNPDLLIASHIKPWAISSDQEKLDPFNGFLFGAHIDRLFDKGLISFCDDGRIIISRYLSENDAKALNIHAAIVLPLKQQNKKYLAEHRRLFRLE